MNSVEGIKRPKLRFRNYLPESQELVPNFVQPPTIEIVPDPFASELQKMGNMDEITVYAPSVALDLKTDIEPKLNILAKRTQRAIVDLIRKRLASSHDGEEL
uniref:Uncharacterized protein n=1 Tax=Aureoumbra lagunensis TaxID=44058 RepID=A0A7S3K171_9STRA